MRTLHVGLGDSPVQPLCCEACGEPTTAESWIEGLHALICPLCLPPAELEAALAAKSMEPRSL